MFTDNVSVDLTSTVLDQLEPPYYVSAPHHPVVKLHPGFEVIQFHGLTPETQQSGAVQISVVAPEIADGADLPAIQTLGRARLNIRSISRLSPPNS